jgi:hypothetical protein
MLGDHKIYDVLYDMYILESIKIRHLLFHRVEYVRILRN